MARLLSHYWQPDETDADTQARLADWVEVLSVFPDWAIRAAMLDFQRDGSKARPTPGAISRLCNEQVRPVSAEIAKARAVLDRMGDTPKPAPSPDQKARVTAMVARVTKGV